ncbi:MAG TPA: dTDP-4-dehydrorhamnose 3,5-epimerase [Candidatus Limnocylindrales bacterium]|nr:dTDP-4-dehydrorhamnose 3,5-epimerase [Candidatus Limnocylindrales bacterium]
MKVLPTEIPGVLVLEPTAYSDERGFLLEAFQLQRYREAGVSCDFVLDTHSRSRRGVVRGLHYQLVRPQAKLVRVVRGAVFDVVVDVRRGSPTFGKWVGTVLDDRQHRQVFVPVGFAHGFAVLSEEADFQYKCSDYYAPDDQHGIAWDDPEIGIAWPRELGDVVVSEKDRRNPRLSACPAQDLPVYGAAGGCGA